MIGLVNICTFSGRVRVATTYPYDGVHLRGGDLLGPLYGCQDLLLVLEMVGGRQGGGRGERQEEESEKDKSEIETWGGELGGVERLDQYQ